MAKVEHYTACEAQVVHDEGAKGATIRWVIDEKRDGAPNYAMRIIEVAPGGWTPRHTHWFEHENYIVEGEGELLIGDEVKRIGPGDVAFVPGDVLHQYRNTGDKPLKFICGIPLPWIKDARAKLGGAGSQD